MKLSAQVLKSPQFIPSFGTVIIVTVASIVLAPQLFWLFLIIGFAVSGLLYVYFEQQTKLADLEAQVTLFKSKEDEYIIRTEQLKRALHDIRSPISALKLRLHMLEKTSNDDGKVHIRRMEDSLSRAVEHVQMIGDIQQGKVAPTETLQLKLADIRAFAQLSQSDIN